MGERYEDGIGGFQVAGIGHAGIEWTHTDEGEEENVEHFLLHCNDMAEERKKMVRLMNAIMEGWQWQGICQSLIKALYQTVGWWVVCTSYSMLCTCEFKQAVSNLIAELTTFVREQEPQA